MGKCMWLTPSLVTQFVKFLFALFTSTELYTLWLYKIFLIWSHTTHIGCSMFVCTYMYIYSADNNIWTTQQCFVPSSFFLLCVASFHITFFCLSVKQHISYFSIWAAFWTICEEKKEKKLKERILQNSSKIY